MPISTLTSPWRPQAPSGTKTSPKKALNVTPSLDDWYEVLAVQQARLVAKHASAGGTRTLSEKEKREVCKNFNLAFFEEHEDQITEVWGERKNWVKKVALLFGGCDRDQEAISRPNIDWQDQIHRGILRGLRNISEAP